MPEIWPSTSCTIKPAIIWALSGLHLRFRMYWRKWISGWQVVPLPCWIVRVTVLSSFFLFRLRRFCVSKMKFHLIWKPGKSEIICLASFWIKIMWWICFGMILIQLTAGRENCKFRVEPWCWSNGDFWLPSPGRVFFLLLPSTCTSSPLAVPGNPLTLLCKGKFATRGMNEDHIERMRNDYHKWMTLYLPGDLIFNNQRFQVALSAVEVEDVFSSVISPPNFLDLKKGYLLYLSIISSWFKLQKLINPKGFLFYLCCLCVEVMNFHLVN